MIVKSIPTAVETAFREKLGLGPDESGRGWQVWVLGTPALACGIGGAKLAGYEFSAASNPELVLEMLDARDKDIASSEGVLAGKLQKVLGIITELPQANDPDRFSELRSLRIPALYLEALWLHSGGGHIADVVVPYSAYDDIDLREMQPYALESFLGAAARAAGRRVVVPSK